ncbi:MAG: hypothetical protein DU429_08900 [Candidatus Tokpelaia sp.]|nr:MAG: hypothetical protein DU429_08900 [Candidatus Tokpelaia sp.]KAA6206583.1 MAG: hypothetical protein DU430_00385 [Candidatus Tokpelaia sp.]
MRTYALYSNHGEMPACGLCGQEAAAFIADCGGFKLRHGRLGAWVLRHNERRTGQAYDADTEAAARRQAAPYIIERAQETDEQLPISAVSEEQANKGLLNGL